MKALIRNPRIAIARSSRPIAIVMALSAGFTFTATAQTYPNPDFNNEVYAYRKDSGKLTRLEKETATIQQRSSFGGMGGASMQYEVDGKQAPIRMIDMDQYTFVFWTGSTGTEVKTGSGGDSAMRANGMDPNMFNGFGGLNPSQIALYKMDISHDKRIIALAKGGGFNFSKKSGPAGTISTSFRKVRDGYFEIVLDKKLMPGEYAFVIQQTGMAAAGGGVVLFCFGVN
jgi:hypothetical protein